MTTYIPIGEWLPDLPCTGLAPQTNATTGQTSPGGAAGAFTITNVIPNAQSYRPVPKLIPFAQSIGSIVLGGIIATDPASNNYNYVGDQSALYTLVQQSFSSVTRLVGGAYTVTNPDTWEFANWGNTVIGVNGFTDPPQTISLGAANFANLSQDVPVKGRHIGVMRDFVVLGNVSDSAAQVYRVRWCAINDPTTWSPSAATMADFQDLPSEGGHVQKILGGDFGVVFQERSIWRMTFVGTPLVFQFDKIHNSIGAYAPQSAIKYQNISFFLSQEGFYAFDGTGLNAIGRGKVDQFFLGDLDVNFLNKVFAVLDQNNKLVMWAYPSSSAINGNPDKIIIYSWAFNRWALVTGLNIQFFMQSISTGYTLDGLDAVSTNLDTGIPYSLDSAQWTGGQVVLSAFNSQGQLSKFNGDAMAVTLDSGEFELFKDARAMLTSIRPQVVGGNNLSSISVTVLNKNNLTESASVGYASTVMNSTGFAPVRSTARYFRIRLNTADGYNFTHIMGMEIDGSLAGVR